MIAKVLYISIFESNSSKFTIFAIPSPMWTNINYLVLLQREEIPSVKSKCRVDQLIER